jgi:hypothetical protein
MLAVRRVHSSSGGAFGGAHIEDFKKEKLILDVRRGSVASDENLIGARLLSLSLPQ